MVGSVTVPSDFCEREFFVAWRWRSRVGQGSCKNGVWPHLTCPSPSSPASGFAGDLKKKIPSQTSNCFWVTWNPDYGNAHRVSQLTFMFCLLRNPAGGLCVGTEREFLKTCWGGCVKPIPSWLKWVGLGAKQHWCVFYGQIHCWGLFQRSRQPKLGVAAKQTSREGWVKSPERGLMKVLNLGEGNGGIPKLFLCLKILFSVVHIMSNFR